MNTGTAVAVVGGLAIVAGAGIFIAFKLGDRNVQYALQDASNIGNAANQVARAAQTLNNTGVISTVNNVANTVNTVGSAVKDVIGIASNIARLFG